ncbi:hypothetical protein LX64_04149 [Chitinophaga skermanii]|uniref:Uncharacterized protein n=1 Tax=Chitinophaga skermanii TaxID=331697 RepID=A0A327QB63_9BACT|nr:hypothetical protein [Chitinophaga skermanii]RAJ00443.1 hypothetical protein LX64_04149 [Chitinophaga skermanii]
MQMTKPVIIRDYIEDGVLYYVTEDGKIYVAATFDHYWNSKPKLKVKRRGYKSRNSTKMTIA